LPVRLDAFEKRRLAFIKAVPGVSGALGILGYQVISKILFQFAAVCCVPLLNFLGHIGGGAGGNCHGE
jgi:hypothetical protein